MGRCMCMILGTWHLRGSQSGPTCKRRLRGLRALGRRTVRSTGRRRGLLLGGDSAAEGRSLINSVHHPSTGNSSSRSCSCVRSVSFAKSQTWPQPASSSRIHTSCCCKSRSSRPRTAHTPLTASPARSKSPTRSVSAPTLASFPHPTTHRSSMQMPTPPCPTCPPTLPPSLETASA